MDTETMDTRTGGPLEIMARLGYGARGVVYCLIGGLAVLAAFGSGGKVGGSKSALQTLLGEPFGQAILGVIAVGLFCFAAWRVAEPLADADHLGTSGKALVIRGGHLVSSAAYIGLGIYCLSLIFGWGAGGGDDQSAKDWTAWLLGKPFGQWLVGIAGVIVIGVGVSFLKRGWNGDVTEHLALPHEMRRWIVLLGRIGFVARGLVFALIGVFLIIAAIESNSAEAKGLGGALKSLQAQPYGWILLAVTAAGLLAFGIFAFAQAFYRRIDSPDLEDLKDSARQGLREIPH